MTESFLLSRLLLTFRSEEEDLLGELSAIARTPDGHLWVGSDEYTSIERLTPMGEGAYGNHQTIPLKDFVELSDQESEIDIEGMTYADGYLWVIGSHSLKRGKPKGKNMEKDIKRLADIRSDANRYLLARLPVLNGEIVPTYAPSNQANQTRSAARLQAEEKGSNMLMETLMSDPHLGPFLSIGLPSKDNGLDIEGIAVLGDRIFLGLRGPVLRGWAIILEIKVEESFPGTLSLQPLSDKKDSTDCLYRKHFLNLNGQGIRDLCSYGDDLLVLAGPTMDVEGLMQVFCLRSITEPDSDQDHAAGDRLWEQDGDTLSHLFDLPFAVGGDRAEGLTLIPCLGYNHALVIAYDSPLPHRRPSPCTIFADVFRIPTSHSYSRGHFS